MNRKRYSLFVKFSLKMTNFVSLGLDTAKTIATGPFDPWQRRETVMFLSASGTRGERRKRGKGWQDLPWGLGNPIGSMTSRPALGLLAGEPLPWKPVTHHASRCR